MECGRQMDILAVARVAAGALLVTLAFAGSWSVPLTLAVVIVLGIPHGALDGEVARARLRPVLGPLWFAAFAVPYLCLVACVLLAWRWAPLPTLAAFLAASVWHFGTEDAGPRPFEAFVVGGLPVAAPTLLQPAATARFLGTVAMTPLATLPIWLELGAGFWCVAAVVWAIRSAARGDERRLPEFAGLLGAFAVLPPLSAFAIYFICLHAPRHMQATIADRRLPRVGGWREAIIHSVPISGLTVLIGAGLWHAFPGSVPERLLCLTIEGLAALTLPHILINDVHIFVARAISRRLVNDGRLVRVSGRADLLTGGRSGSWLIMSNRQMLSRQWPRQASSKQGSARPIC